MPSPTSSSEGPAAAAITIDKQNAVWTHGDVVAYLDFLITKVASAGEGGNFKMPIFNAAAKLMNARRTSVGLKTGKGCQNKYTGLRKTLKVVDHLKNHASGFTYDDENGANIGIAEQNAWEVYVKVHRDAKPFRNKGWPYLAKMEQLVPSQAKGAHHGDMPPSPDAPFSPSVWDMEKPDYQGGDDDDDDEERENEKEKEPEEQRSNSPTPIGTGRKRAATTTPLQPPKRVRRSGGADSLSNIAAACHEFNDITSGFRPMFTTPPKLRQPYRHGSGSGSCHTTFQPSPVRKANAVDRAQELEAYLASSDLAILLDILGKIVGWVQDQLRKQMMKEGLDLSLNF
ncbi:hypothetical protein B0H13DRAFT_2337430 [Mycena leptocephala]|nr:hypothetical protein B0H13DRAFT_2337430 [Mycena leptocephala]